MTREQQVDLIAHVLAYVAALKHKIPYAKEYAEATSKYFRSQAAGILDTLSTEKLED